MKYTAKWGPKGFIVSPSKVVPFDEFTAGFAIKSEQNADTSGTAKTNNLGHELETLAFSTTYVRAAGVDPRAQVEEWESLIGKTHTLYIGGKQFGPLLLQLKKVDVSDLMVDNNGLFLMVKVSITLEEYAIDTKTGGTGTGTGSGSGSGKAPKDLKEVISTIASDATSEFFTTNIKNIADGAVALGKTIATATVAVGKDLKPILWDPMDEDVKTGVIEKTEAIAGVVKSGISAGASIVSGIASGIGNSSNNTREENEMQKKVNDNIKGFFGK